MVSVTDFRVATETHFVDHITVSPTSQAYRAGLRTGDRVDLRQLSVGDRYRWVTSAWRRDEPIQAPVLRGGAIHHVSVTAVPFGFTWDIWLATMGILWMLLFAALIAWRRAESPEARTLALLLILMNLGIGIFPQNWMTPWPALDAALACLGAILFYVGIALFATYAMLFARPPTLVRRILAWLSYGSAGVAAIVRIASIVNVWTLIGVPGQTWFSGSPHLLVTDVLPSFFLLLCVLVTLAQTRGAERSRITWAAASLGFLYAALATDGMLAAFDPTFNYLFSPIPNTAAFIAPIGLTYSLLNRRLLDIGFAINRAAVFSGVSIIIVGIFVLAEWAMSTWLSTASHTTNLAIGAALALALGLSVRAIHARVDRTLDVLFFRKRHEDEQAIRTFAHEAAYITDVPTLLGRAVETLERHADASFVTLALDDNAGRYGEVSENDPAIVALRAGRKIVDLHTIRTDVSGDFAYPMNARGRLVGALVIGPKRSDDAYAPDESDAIAQLAHALGDALDVLSTKKDESRDALLDAIQTLSKQVSEGFERLRPTGAQP